MKLIKFINIRIFFFISIILIFCGILFYNLLQKGIYNSTVKVLVYEAEKIKYTVLNTNEIPLSNTIIDITPMYESELKEPSFKDTIISLKDKGFKQHCLNYTFYVKVKGKYYNVTLQQNMLEDGDIARYVSYLVSFVFLLLGLTTLFVTGTLIKSGLKPFYITLNKIRDFNVREKEIIRFNDVKIQEFRDLNNVLSKMTEKITTDYRNLKEYNENISHEVQTPLAVIRSKLENIINEENLTESQIKLISVAYNNTIELSAIMKGLSLISKIENLEFAIEKVNLKKQLDKTKINFNDFLESRNIFISIEVDDFFEININKGLADILFNNLLKNAYSHNIDNGFIKIYQEKTNIIFQNSTDINTQSNINLLERFKNNQLDVSYNGIGLSIINKICETNEFKIKMNIENNICTIIINFGNSTN